MAVPKKKLSHTRSGNRRSHLRQDRPAMTVCWNCQAIIKPHTVCPNCGYYRGQPVV